MTRRAMFLGLFALSLALLGCGKEGEVSKTQEAALKDNFSRSLTPEEVARMNSAKPAAPPAKGK